MKKNYISHFNFCNNLAIHVFKSVQQFVFLAFLFLILGFSKAYAQFPDQFAKVELASGMSNTTTFKFAPDGRIFILDRYGELLIYDTSVGVQVSGGTIPVFHDLEDGLLGIAFDPDFVNNNLIYLYYSPINFSGNRVSQFTMNGGTLDLSSESILLQWQTNRVAKYHSGGDMDFDSQGNLYIATGDNTTYPDTYTAISPTNTISVFNEESSAEKSSSNTNDLRGKILRVTPFTNGTYTVPVGNLFPGGSGGLPEIYVMGVRNPYRVFVDKENSDWLFWGEVGPDALVASSQGPVGMDEINIAKTSGNFGWPYFSGKNNSPYDVPYVNPSPFYNNPLSPQNTSVYNTGVTNLPAAEPALMAWGGFDKCILAGFRYKYDASLTDVQRLPVEFDDAFFFYDFNRSLIFLVNLDVNGNVVQNDSDLFTMPRFASSTFPANRGLGLIDMELGPDGKMYILEYGAPCCESDAGPTGRLIRVDYTGITSNSPPVIELSANQTNGSLPLVVNFSTVGTTDPNGDSPLTYEWDFDMSGGTPDSTDPNPTFTYNTAGTFNVQLKVNDGNAVNGQSIKNITIYAGNNVATFTVNSPVDGGLFNWGDDVVIDIDTQDPEDGIVNCNNVILQPGFGHLTHVHPELSTTTCPQTITITEDAAHNGDGDLDIFSSFSLSHTDTGGLISRDLITLHPKRKEAEFYDSQGGTATIANNDPLEGGAQALRVDSGGYISFSARNLLNITTVKYKVASANSGGTIEMRLGGVTGTVLATTIVPATGGTDTWVSVETNFTDPGGKNDLFFVFNGTGSAIFDLNYVEFLGNGTSIDNSPPTLEDVSALNDTSVVVKFSEYLDQSTAETIGNYSIDNAITISAADLQSDGKTVFLTVTSLDFSTSYNLTVSNVENTGGLGITSDSFSFSLIGDIHINSGGPQVIWSFDTFIADQYSTGGTEFSNSSVPIDGSIDDELYQTELFGTIGGVFSYEIPVGVIGEYDIRLHFAELFFGVGAQSGGPGSRVFNVSIEGNTVLSNFDILSEVSPATALTKEFNNILINDGFASVVFTGITQSAKVNGIEVLDKDTFDDTSNSDITITSPSNGWNVNQPFEVAFNVENWTILPNDTHVHYYIDDMMVGPYYSYEPIAINNLSLGEHKIKIELFNADHTATGIFDEVTVNVTGDLSLTCNETPFPDQWAVKQLESNSLPSVSVYTFADFDLDGDGLKDIVTGGWWYKNPGTVQGNWSRSTIGIDFDNVVWVYDFDSDGDLDLLGTTDDGLDAFGYEGSDMVWAQNNGSGAFTIFSNIPSGDTTYSEPFLAGIAGGVFSVGGTYQMAINWNGAETGSGSPMQLLTPPTDPTIGMWTLTTLTTDSTGEDIQVGDIDQDNDLDLFQGTNWIRNNGGGNWETISTGISYDSTVDRAQLADFDRDGDLDAVVGQLGFGSGNLYEFAWFEAPADPTQTWIKHVLDTDIQGSLSVFATDIDFDGDEDIVVGEWLGSYRLIAFENDLCDSGNFIKRVLNTGIPGQEHHDGARVTDIDNDGDLDIISNGWWAGTEIRNFPRIYENTTIAVEDEEPVVDGGQDQNILPGNTTLNGTANDPDGGAIVSYAWSLVSGPNVPTLSGEDTPNLIVNNLVEGAYEFRLEATDDEADTGFDTVTVTVSNQLPSIRINAGGPSYTFNTEEWIADQNFIGGETFDDSSSIENTLNDEVYQTERYSTTGTLVYNIPVINGDFNINLHFAELFYGVDGQPGGIGSRVFDIQVENEVAINNYDIVDQAGDSLTAVIESLSNVTVSDGMLTITLTAVTEFPKISGIEVLAIVPPEADAGLDQSIVLPINNVVLNGSGSDSDGGTVTYQWSQEIGGPSTATLTNADTADLTAEDLVEGTYIFRLTVTDDEADTSFDDVTITVLPDGTIINVITVNAGEDQILTLPDNSITLNGSGSFSDGGAITYQWTQESVGPSTATLTNTDSADLTASDLIEGIYIFRLTVTDDEMQADFDDVTVTVLADGTIILIVDAGEDQTLTLPDNSITLNGSGSSSDGGTVTYQWIQESVGPSTATLANADTADLTASELIEGTYTFRLTLTNDEAETVFDDVTITVLPEDNTSNMLSADAGEDQEVTLPVNSITLNGTGSSSDEGMLTYQWTQQTGPSMNAVLSGNDAATLTVSDLEEGEYVFRLTVTDENMQTAFDEVIVNVVLDAPEMEVVLQLNPSEDGIVRIEINNVQEGQRVLFFSIYDAGGRYILGFSDPSSLDFVDGAYHLPVPMLESSLYFVRVNMNEGNSILLKLLINNN